MAAKRPTEEADPLLQLAHLSSSVCHHLINAFSANVSNSEVLRLASARSVGSVDRDALTGLIIDSSIDASGIARRLINFARVITKPGESSVRLDEVLRSACEHLSTAARGDVECHYDLQPLDPVNARPSELMLMFGAILANSIEALPDGSGVIEVASRIDERGWNQVTIRDRGQGMDETTLEHALDPFFTTKQGHDGIGLSVANSIWRRHRGSMLMESRPGEGTLVTLVLPPRAIVAPPVPSL